jgi:hypothetical protein
LVPASDFEATFSGIDRNFRIETGAFSRQVLAEARQTLKAEGGALGSSFCILFNLPKRVIAVGRRSKWPKSWCYSG